MGREGKWERVVGREQWVSGGGRMVGRVGGRIIGVGGRVVGREGKWERVVGREEG